MSGTTKHIIDSVLVHLVQGPGHDSIGSEAGHQQHEHPVEDGQGREQSHSYKPEPEEHIDLLIDDVQSKDTETIMGCDGSRRSIFVEGAFGHLGEDFIHWIMSVLRTVGCHCQNIPAIGGELITKKPEITII